MKQYLGLLLIIVVSFWAISNVDISFDEGYDDTYDSVKLLAPGVLFSMYLIILRFEKITAKASLINFSILVIGYMAILFTSLSTWGLAVPIAGGVGGVLVNYVLHDTLKFDDGGMKNFFIMGCLSGLSGLVIYYLTKEFFNDGIGFGAIIIIWQLIIGILFIKQLKVISQTTSANN
jgi:hypothetical protein